MAKANSTALPADEGVLIRRLYFSLGAQLAALDYLIRSKDDPRNLRCAIDVMIALDDKINGYLDELGVPRSWREVYAADCKES